MRFKVIYDNEFLFGQGSVFMYDTALVFEGGKPKFTIPFLQFCYKLILIKTTRTVPYSTILQYRKSKSIYYDYHRITYRLPNGQQCKIGFSMLKEYKNKNNIFFTTKLEEYLAVIKNFSFN